jgi:hypothetical protein
VGVLLGSGDGNLQSSLTYAVNSLGPESVSVGDFNRDGNLDLAAETELGAVIVLLGRGNGGFQPEVDYSILGGYGKIEAADLNGDGVLDLAVTSSGLPKPGANELIGNGDGTFQASQFFPAGNALYSLAVGDFNGDHKTDLVLGDNLYGAITLLNTGVVKLSPTTALNFPVQLINTKSVPQSTTLTNTGTAALSIRSVRVTGAFQSSSNCKGSVGTGEKLQNHGDVPTEDPRLAIRISDDRRQRILEAAGRRVVRPGDRAAAFADGPELRRSKGRDGERAAADRRYES